MAKSPKIRNVFNPHRNFPGRRLCAKSLVKPGFSRVQDWLNQPDFSGFQSSLIRLYHNLYVKSLLNQGIPGKSGKPGYSKNQETRLKPGS